MIRLDLNSPDNRVVTEIRSRLINVYSRLALDDNYQRNLRKLGLIQIFVITVSAIATGATNAFAHLGRLGYVGAIILALFIMSFVEVFYFTLRDGLATVYKGTQRLAAGICYRTIQVTMVLNGAVLCVWVVGFQMPAPLAVWNRWSIVIHFTLALVGVPAVRDSDPVTANAMLELKAETAKQDLITLRKAAQLGNPFVMLAAKIRGVMDGFKLALSILKDTSGSYSVSGSEASDPDAKDALLLPSAETQKAKVTDLGKFGRR